jgi:uncharacterized protein involved in exopolysaccharide biosynthesis
LNKIAQLNEKLETCESSKTSLNDSLNEHIQIAASRLNEITKCEESETVLRQKLESSMNRADEEYAKNNSLTNQLTDLLQEVASNKKTIESLNAEIKKLKSTIDIDLHNSNQ